MEATKVDGGAGNPGGNSYKNYNNHEGTGGLLIINAIKLVNNGKIQSNGVIGGRANAAGGSSGGGSINIFYKEEYINNGTIISNGGETAIGIDLGGGGNISGGSGGDGTVTIGNISSGSFVRNDVSSIYELIPEESESTVKNKTTENGVIQYEDIYGGKIRTEQEYESNYYAWNAFSKNSTSTMSSNASSHYVEYEFPNEVYALKTKFSITNGSESSGTRKLVIQGFNEKNNVWENISKELSYTGNAFDLSTEQNIDLITNKPYKKFKLQFIGVGSEAGNGNILSGIRTFQLYGEK